MMGGIFSEGRGRTLAYVVGCVLLFFGERMFAASTGPRLGLDAVGAVAVLISLALRWRDVAGLGANLSGVQRPLALFHTLSVAGLGLYALQVGEVRDLLGMAAAGGAERDVFGVALAVLWPIVWLAGAAPMALLEQAAAPMRRAESVEGRRVSEAARAGLSIALAAAFLFVGNYLATQHDSKVDLAYYRTARPGSATVALVKKLEEPVHVYLFFPKANDVLEQVQGYFDELAKHTGNLKVEVTDRLLRPGLAKQYQVRQDGTVVLARDKKKERWRIGVKLTTARRDLAKLDGEFNKRLSKVASPERFAYLVTGHGELNNPDRSEDSLAKARDKAARRVLEWQGYKVKTLGLAQGLGTAVPEDAGLVLVLGAQSALMQAEGETLAKYVRGGGRLLLAIEPSPEAVPEDLLEVLGLRYGDGILTHDKVHLRRRFDASDRQLLPSNSFSSHGSVRSLSRDSRHLAVVVDRAGHLERLVGPLGAKGIKVEFTVRTITGTWADTNGDREYQPGEKKKTRHIAAAVTIPKPKGAADKGEDAKEAVDGRAVVFADGDVVSDSLMGAKGNVVLFADGLRWLQGEDDLAGTIESEADVAVEHTKEEDALWFHGTVFAMPLFIGTLGWFRIRRRRRQA